MDTSDLTSRGYGAVLWEPDQQTVHDARITRFMRWLAVHIPGPIPGRGHDFGGYADLWQWSVTEPGSFWAAVWDYFEVLGHRDPGPVLTGEVMPDVQWFTGTTLNYARNALRTAWTDPDRTAIIFDSERTRAGRLTYAQLAQQVARVARGLRALGVRRGDRVAALLPNVPEAVIGLLATASIGAIWSSCSPDFGARSVIDRFAQIEPTVLIAGDGYWYGGKEFSRAQMVDDVVAALPGLSAVVLVDLIEAAGGFPDRFIRWDNLGAEAESEQGQREPEFEEVPFEHPLWVVYSSGTTGLPKPIMHGHGGIVLEHLKALAFHQDLRPGDVFTWYTTTGWMMWNYLAGGLLAGLTIVLYDGSATYPDTGRLWRLAAEHGVTYLGVGAPYLVACMKAGLRPGDEADLSALRAIGSTGSPLPPEAFGWVYDRVSKDLLLGSFSGGTDLCTGFVGPCPLLPVRAGIISGRCLGAEVEAYDDDGQPVIGQVGELVITQPMPSMPVGFWNDPGGARYRESYFDVYPGIWRHGDWIELLPDGGCVIYGRSDATLNRGGVRMGTSEFYRVVEGFGEVGDSLVVDTGRLGAEGRLILYVVPAAGCELDDDLAARLRAALRSQLSPRHVPDEIHQVPGIPRTLSGKKLEVPVRKILLGTEPERAADPNALANPEVLAYFGGFRGVAPPGQHSVTHPHPRQLLSETTSSQWGDGVVAGPCPSGGSGGSSPRAMPLREGLGGSASGPCPSGGVRGGLGGSSPRASTAQNHKGVDSGRDAGQRRSRDQGSPAGQGGRGLGGQPRAGPRHAGRRRRRPVLPARLLPPGGHRGPALALAAGGGGAGPRPDRPAPAAGPGADPGPGAGTRASGPGHPGQPGGGHRHRRHAVPGRLGHDPAEPPPGRDLAARAPAVAGAPGRDRRAA